MFSRFRSTIAGVSEADIRRDPTLGGCLRLFEENRLAAFYAPFDHVATAARLVLVGITPGAQQAMNALIAARAGILSGHSDSETLATAKVFASFSGPMRSNLVAMLDHIGLAARMGLRTCASLWDTDSALVHFTSALRYPVFVGGANYSGQPSMTRTPSLRAMLHEYLAAEAKALPDAVWIPLGPPAVEGVQELVRLGKLSAAQVLEGLPHPSGANRERIAYFVGQKAREALSAKTNAAKIDRVRARLMAQVATL